MVSSAGVTSLHEEKYLVAPCHVLPTARLPIYPCHDHQVNKKNLLRVSYRCIPGRGLNRTGWGSVVPMR